MYGDLSGAPARTAPVTVGNATIALDLPGIKGVLVEWDGDGNLNITGANDSSSWRYSGCKTHLPPYTGVLYCVKDQARSRSSASPRRS